MDAVKFDVNVVDSVISWQETHRVDVGVDGRNKAIVFASGWRNHLKKVGQILHNVHSSVYKDVMFNYLSVELPLSAVLTNDESLGFVGCATGVWELSDFNFVCVTLFWADVNTERRIGDVLVIEFYANTVFT